MKRSRMGTPTVYRNALVGNSAYTGISVSGGVISSDGMYNYHSFTSSGSFTVTGGTLSAEVLVVAGGGGSGGLSGGGGGAGGALSTSLSLAPGTYAASVGAGGSYDAAGTLSSFHGLLTANGGGSGKGTADARNNGASGGGGREGSTAGGTGIPGQGYAGGTGASDGVSWAAGGGGGGVNQLGQNATGAYPENSYGGPGGNGTGGFNGWGYGTGLGHLYGGVYFFGGGGGGAGGGGANGNGGAGGYGGGGNGGAQGSKFAIGSNGTANTGGGAGGAGTASNGGAAVTHSGGSGVVIVRYLKSAVADTAADFELIGTVTLSSAQTSVQFNKIPNDYKHLQLRIVGRTDRASTYDGGKIRFNGGTSTDYAYHQLTGNGSAVNSYGDAAATYWYLGIGSFEAANSASGAFGIAVCDILDAFSTNKNKTMRSLSGSITVPSILLQSGLWVDTSAISSLTVYPDVGSNFVTNSRFSLYGVRG